jgi:hypothetical protein
MSRSLYLIAGLLAAFAVVATVLSLLPAAHQPGLPAVASPWRTAALLLALGALASALLGVLTNLFEQIDRRSEERRLSARHARRPRP